MGKDKLKVKLMAPDAKAPSYVHEQDSGMDLFSISDTVIKPGERQNIRTGIAIELPEGSEAQVRSRSGLAFHQGIIVLNSPGTIDEGYRGELFVLLVNLGSKDFIVEKGMRIAQLVVSPVIRPLIEKVEGELTNSSRNDKYEDKIKHYVKENIYVQTLHQDCYSKNPNFINSQVIQSLGFKAHPQFKKKDIEDREKLVQRLCENLWSVDYFSK